MRVTINNLDKTFMELRKKITSESKSNLEKESKLLVTELIMQTPVDTGLARDSWNLKLGDSSAVIENDVPYIEELNNGHSKQAPANFIESTAIQYGKPVGSIVTIK